MITHKDFESDCKRIAKYIMQQATNTQSEQFEDMMVFGSVVVDVSPALIKAFNANKYKDVPRWEREINKHLKGCSVKYNTLGYHPNWYIKFDIEFDDVDAETDDW